jgi:TatD DNase family protein
VIDTHCHLTFADFAEPAMAGGVSGVLARAHGHGVTGCITISTTTRDCLDALAIARAHDRVWCTAGVHPLYSDRGPHEWANLSRVITDPRCVAWGELGLDNHYDRPDRATQHAVLEEQLDFIRRTHGAVTPRPVVLHCREAFGDLIPILRRAGLDPTRLVFHCFTGTPGDMRQVLDLGAMVSFTGVVTYRNAAEVREALRLVPDDRFMAETDAPFLSPDPHRGVRPCEPWMASVTAAKLAEVRGVPLPRLLEQLDSNTHRFFGVR